MKPGSPQCSLILIMLIVNVNMCLGGSLPTTTEDGMDFCRKDSDCKAPHICNMKNPSSPFCDCNPKLYTWSMELAKCVGLVNTPCSGNRSETCINNSFCNQNGLCQCSPSHSATEEKHCLLKYDFPCDDRKQEYCNPELFLGCLETKRCGCKFPGQMKYEATFGECRMLVGEACGPANDMFHNCVQGAECLELWPGSVKLECRCEFGRIVDPATKTCLPSYQAQCQSRTDCDVENNMVCSIQNNGKGRCACNIGMTWDERDQECRVLPGESCSVTKLCSDNASCSPASNTCECDIGHTVHRRTRTCVPSHGSTCDLHQPCNEESLLRCNLSEESGNCECIEGHEWSESQQHCISLIGNFCGEFQSCTQHAFCNQSELCECYPSYSKTPQQTCLLQFGSPCIGTGCNFYEFLECREDQCTCQAFALPEGQKCKSFIGGPCGLFKETMTNVECYAGTTCVLDSQSQSGTCQLSSTSKISNLRTGSITLYVLIVMTGLGILGLLIYLAIRKVPRKTTEQ